MEFSNQYLDGIIVTIKSLHYIMLHSKDKEVQEKCRELITILHKKALLPMTDQQCLLT